MAKSVHQYFLSEKGAFPNNPKLPALHYPRVTDQPQPQKIKDLFESHDWRNSWINGIYDYHHYHSNTHEVLGISAGEATVMLGGDGGEEIKLKAGDVLIIPAGVAHKCLHSSRHFKCVGAYPRGSDYDMNYGKEEEKEQAKKNIDRVPLPKTDPVFGAKGPMMDAWI